MYKETGKERVIRFSIIAAIATVTLYLFVNQYTPDKKFTTATPQKTEVKQLAVVLQEKNQNQEFPKLAMVKEHEGEPILVTYRVNTEKEYRFETIQAVNLKNAPADMMQDEITDGVWLKEDNKWIYYNPQLQVEKRDENFRSKAEGGYHITVDQLERGTYRLQVSGDQGPILEKTLEEDPVSVVRLSESDDLWFVLFEKDTILLVP